MTGYGVGGVSPNRAESARRAVTNDSREPLSRRRCACCRAPFAPYRAIQRFCSDPCRHRDWEKHHPRQPSLPEMPDLSVSREEGKIEAGKKKRAMRGSAALNAPSLRIARDAAWRVLVRDGDSDADRVRLLLESEGTELPWTSGWPGSIYPGDPDHDWVTVRRVKSKHKGGKCREIRVWK